VSEGAAAGGAPGGSAVLALIRHGESRWNAAGVLQGQQCAGLSELGRAQADALAGHLPKIHGGAALIVRSDIDRVAQTAEPTERVFDTSAEVEPRLREIDLGSWSGRPRAEVLAEASEDLQAWLRCEDVRPGGGERLSELRERVWAAVRDIGARVRDAGGGTALLFTHGGPVRTSVAAVLGLPVGEERRLQPVRNASITLIRLDPDDVWRLVAYNQTDHLP
jgi:broad specificity phosphatase PhoE